MDFVKKIICLEDARTRTQGLMPYFEFGKEYPASDPSENPMECKSVDDLGLTTVTEEKENGNWGQFVANPCFLGTGKTYNTLLHNYYELLNMVRNGVKLRKVDTKEDEVIFTEDVGAFEWNGRCFEGGVEPEYLYEYAAYNANSFTSTEMDSLREETRHIYRTNIPVSETHIVLIENYDKFLSLCSYLDSVTVPSSVTDKSIGSDEHKKWADYCQIVDDCIGVLHVKSSIYNEHLKTPKTMALADVKSYLDWLIENKDGDCCSKKLWEDKGGDDMIEFLNEHINDYTRKLSNLNSLEYRKPFLEIPLLFTQNFTDVGVLTNIDGVDYDSELEGPSQAPGETDSRPHGELQKSPNNSGFTNDAEIEKFTKQGKGICIDQIIMGQERKTYPATGDGAIEVESQLQTLRSRKKYLDDKNNVLPGLFEEYPGGGKVFVCVKLGDKKFYNLTVSAYTVDPETHEVIDWCLKYVEAEAQDTDIYGQNNIMDAYPSGFPIYDAGLTRSDADGRLGEQSDTYDQYPKDGPANPSNYLIMVYEPVWTMYEAFDGATAKECINEDGKESSEVKYEKEDDYRIAKGKSFRTITTEAAGIRIAETEEEEINDPDEAETHYVFVVKYHNSGCPMDIPYKTGNTANVYALNSGDPSCTEYRGDFIKEITPKEKSVEFEYVIGGFFEGTTDGKYIRYISGGDVYHEVRTLDPDHVDYVPLDGVDNVPVWSNFLDFDIDAKEFYSPRYNLYRTGNTANIIEMTTGEYWNEDYAIDAYLTKEDYLINFSNPPKLDINVTIDRGGVSAFERHYKLSECNTMQDLEQYHNGEFFENGY